MNGLKYIRMRCNLSISELADHLGVTRQALSAWENAKKEMPEKRRVQLEDFFGIDKKYFVELSEEDKEFLDGKAMFQYNDNGKESYRFKPPAGVTDIRSTCVYFMGDVKMSLDEAYGLALNKKEETIKKVDDIIKWRNVAGDEIESKIMSIERGCHVYGMINELMEEMRGMKTYLRIPFYYELLNVWKAMLLAYDLMNEDEVLQIDKQELLCGEDKEWIQQLAEQIKSHWNTELAFQEEHYKNVWNDIKRDLKLSKNADTEVEEEKSIKEQIVEVERRHKEKGQGKSIVFWPKMD